MDDQELEFLLKNIESDRVERKASISDKNRLCEAICAFANDLPNHQQPGVLFIGVNDNGSCANLSIDDKLLLTLASIRSDGNILPFPTIIVQKRNINGCELAIVIVEPSDAPPVRFNGRVWIRVGPRKATATPEEERRLAEKRRWKDLPFDLRPLEFAELQDLNLELFLRNYLPSSVAVDILQENQRSVEQQLSGVRFAKIEPSPKPTVLGILVIGNDPRQYVPCAYVQFLRIDGKELTDPIKDQKEIGGSLIDLLRMLDEILQAHISIATDVTAQPIEIRQPDYPIVALRQLAKNAVMHRTYEGTNAPVRITWFNDRIEIQNPGGPFGQVTRQNFGQPGITDYRNPHLAEAMKNLGHVQRFGMGIEQARQQLEKNGNPPLEFIVEDTYVLAILKKRL
ncbi:ATP-binding protein [Anabaena azotica]|uniref:DNA binding domain-containing protein n=1 Tax=Anabaena azotica FACHB-119 TaxID=947527 RepID=A0ABR8D8D7_9NOST|nr:ATP-binding protein [Anabaena azotica]MBD2503206.1 putative DNA binding domain-containing protein [Anabaena azotica FACHB-119]